jgi:hypothetical protein
MEYQIIQLLSPNELTKKVFKFGNVKCWVSTWERDTYNQDDWGKLNEKDYPIYFATMLINQLRKDGWKRIT